MKKRPIKQIILVCTISIALFSVLLIQGVAATKVGINKKKATILVSKTLQLKIQGKKKVKWSSSNKKVAKVSKTGKVTGVKPGKATIKAKVKNKTFKCVIKVKIGLDKKKIVLKVGKTTKVKLCGSKIKKVSSSKKSVATVTKKGIIKAKGVGKTILTITGKNKKKYKCIVTVIKTPAKTTQEEKEASSTKKGYQVTFDSKGGSEINSQEVEEGNTAIAPAEPEYSGYTFDYWELDDKKYDFTTPITADITLKAKWTKKNWENAAKIKEIIETDKSEDVPSENKVIDIFNSRGFGDYTPIFNYDMDGNYIGENEVTDGSTEKHPMYITYYLTDKGDVWTIYNNNGTVFAYPASYNLESDREMLVSESEDIVSYDNVANQYFVTNPDDSLIIKVVDKIDAETLDNLTKDEFYNKQ